MNLMENLLKKAFNYIVGILTLTGFVISLKIFKPQDILVLSGIGLFIIFLYLINSQMGELEKEIIKIKDSLKQEKRICAIEAKLINIKK